MQRTLGNEPVKNMQLNKSDVSDGSKLENLFAKKPVHFSTIMSNALGQNSNEQLTEDTITMGG